jgi:hypothetical protein
MPERVSDYTLQMIHNGLEIPFAHTVRWMERELKAAGVGFYLLTPAQMALKIRELRGIPNPAAC